MHCLLCIVREFIERLCPYRNGIRIPVSGLAKFVTECDTGHDVVNGDLGVHLGDGGEEREVRLAHERCCVQFLKNQLVSDFGACDSGDGAT